MTLAYLFGIEFALRGCKELCNVTFDKITEQTDEDGFHYFQYRENAMQNNQGGLKSRGKMTRKTPRARGKETLHCPPLPTACQHKISYSNNCMIKVLACKNLCLEYIKIKHLNHSFHIENFLLNLFSTFSNNFKPQYLRQLQTPFFLYPNTKPSEDEWYSNKPIGKIYTWKYHQTAL